MNWLSLKLECSYSNNKDQMLIDQLLMAKLMNLMNTAKKLLVLLGKIDRLNSPKEPNLVASGNSGKRKAQSKKKLQLSKKLLNLLCSQPNQSTIVLCRSSSQRKTPIRVLLQIKKQRKGSEDTKKRILLLLLLEKQRELLAKT